MNLTIVSLTRSNLKRLKTRSHKILILDLHLQLIYLIALLSSHTSRQSWLGIDSRLKHKLLLSHTDLDSQILPQIDLRDQVDSLFLS